MNTNAPVEAGRQNASEAMHRAKRPRVAIAGPYGHPFHPILVTLPIGAWVAAVVFDVISLFADEPGVYSRGAAVLVVIGLIGAVLAAVFGVLDLLQLAAGTKALRIGLTHLTLNAVVVVLFGVGLLFRALQGTDEVSVVGFVLSLIGLVVLGLSGWLGGKLAYGFGVRVADEARQAEAFRRID